MKRLSVWTVLRASILPLKKEAEEAIRSLDEVLRLLEVDPDEANEDVIGEAQSHAVLARRNIRQIVEMLTDE